MENKTLKREKGESMAWQGESSLVQRFYAEKGEVTELCEPMQWCSSQGINERKTKLYDYASCAD